MKILDAMVVLSIAGLLATVLLAAYQDSTRVVDSKGNLRVPADYRTPYQFLGSWAIAADKGRGSKDLHIAYASPGTIAAYRATPKSAGSGMCSWSPAGEFASLPPRSVASPMR